MLTLGFDGPVLRFARRRLVRHLPWYLGGTAALTLTNWITVEIPLFAARGIDALGTDPGETLRVAGLVALLGVAVMAVRTVSRLAFFTPGREVEAEVKRDAFAALLAQRSSFVRSYPAGDLVSRINSDVGNLRLLSGFIALGLVNTVTAFVLTGVQMARLSPVLAGWTVLSLALGFGITLWTARRLHGLMHAIQKSSSDVADQALTSLQAVAGITAWGAEDAFVARLKPLSDQWRSLQMQRSLLRIAFGPALGLATATSVCAVLWTGASAVATGTLTTGEIIAFVALAGSLQGPLRALSFTVSLLRTAGASVERIDELLDAPIDRPDLPFPVPAPLKPPALSFRNLCFRYPGATTDSLTDVSFDVPAGATVGIVGTTGSGKSTLCHLIARIHDPPPGTVWVDGGDLRRIDLDGWRARTTLVAQRPFLFSESVSDNIALGRDVGVPALIEQCALTPDVATWSDGLQTVVGERGLVLSGGQRQRVALARGLARKPGLLILDDVLSAVDAPTARRLLDTLDVAADRPTTFIVSHRVDAVRDADLLVVLHAGRVVEVGKHDDLISRNGTYRSLFDRSRDTAAA